MTITQIIEVLLGDIAFWSYCFNASVSLYGFGLFIYWWSKMGDASSVYKFITALMLAIFIVYGGNVHIRVLMAWNPQEALHFSNTLVWYLRTWLEGVVLLVIVFQMTRRMISTIRKADRFKVEKRDEGKRDKNV